MSNVDVAGFNTRFKPGRFGGSKGAKSANIYPRESEESIEVTDPLGNYDGTVTVLEKSYSTTIEIEVTEAFNNGPTLIVGVPGDTDLFVTLADAVDLTQIGTITIARQAEWPSDSVIRCVVGGTPNQGAANVKVNYTI